MNTQNSIVYTNPAKCRDCYRCVRVCPVKAIKMENGQATVIVEKCISCGTCISECPQHAKSYVNNSDQVLEYLDDKLPVFISIAPSFAAVYPEWAQKRLPSALRQAGFSLVAETAIGAYDVAVKTKEIIDNKPDSAHICTACPAVVSYVQKYKKKHVKYLVPVVSPMVAHARMLKKEFGPNCRVIFAGPCVAKKAEAQNEKNRAFIDAVLTFDELDEILGSKKIDLKKCEESCFDRISGATARLFPLEEGLLKTAGIETVEKVNKYVSVSGFESIIDALENIQKFKNNDVLEPLFCKSGCINGPILRNGNLLEKRRNLLAYSANSTAHKQDQTTDNLNFIYQTDSSFTPANYNEEAIRSVLLKTGKLNEEDELNCGACGYNSCRDKAIAVLDGMAEIEMCIPYMRRLAEQKNDKLIAADPNGIVILNSQLEIIDMNPAFKKMFICSDNLLNQKISYLVDPEPFEQVITNKIDKFNDVIKFPTYKLVCHLLCYAIDAGNQYVGIFVNITDTWSNTEKLKDLKTETILQAQELMEHQITMAQELARLIGDHTAQGEMLMNKLINEILK